MSIRHTNEVQFGVMSKSKIVNSACVEPYCAGLNKSTSPGLTFQFQISILDFQFQISILEFQLSTFGFQVSN